MTRAPQNDTIHRPIVAADEISAKTEVRAPQAPADGPEPLKYSKSAHGVFDCFDRFPGPILKEFT